MRPAVLLVALALAMPIAARAASGGDPLEVSHSGFLLGAADVPVTSPGVTLSFRIFDAATDGAQQWAGTCSRPVVVGYYSASLGGPGCAGDGLDTADVPAGAARWLEVGVDGVLFAPRLLLTMAPNAARTLDSERVGGQTLAQLDARFARIGQAAALGAVTATSISGDGSALTNLSPSALSSTVPDGKLPSNLARTGQAASFGAVTATSFTGDGAAVSNVDAVRLGGKTLAEIESRVGASGVTCGSAGSTGLLRLNGTAFEGCNGTAWVRLDNPSSGPAPTVSAVSPATGPSKPGTLLTLTGTNFTPFTSVRLAGAYLSDVTAVSSTQLTAKIAQQITTPGAYTLEVIAPDGGLGQLVNGYTAVADGSIQALARKSCKVIKDAGGSSGDGRYWIDPNEGTNGTTDAYEAFCDMTTDNGGWTLAIRAYSASYGHNVSGALNRADMATSGAPTQPAKISDADYNLINPTEVWNVCGAFQTLYRRDTNVAWNSTHGIVGSCSYKFPNATTPIFTAAKKTHADPWPASTVFTYVSCGGAQFSGNWGVLSGIYAADNADLGCHNGCTNGTTCSTQSKYALTSTNSWSSSGFVFIR